MRLTTKRNETDRKSNYTTDINNVYVDELDNGYKFATGKAIEKLGQYEDADEKLETDFPTYIKYIDSEKAFVKEDNGDIEECYVIGGTLDSIILMPVAFPYGECEFTRKFQEYGTKWALDRKELENDN